MASNPRGEVAKMRDNTGDTVKELLNGGPADSDASSESNQLKMRAPTGIQPTAIALAGKRKMALALPAKY